MSDEILDLLQIKIDKAMLALPEETRQAINAVNWRDAILPMRDKYGYSFEQLGDLELETELVLCGLLEPSMYPKEIEKRLGLSKSKAEELVSEMNNQVFKKIREELIRIVERKKVFEKKEGTKEIGAQTEKPQAEMEKEHKEDLEILKQTGIHIVSENAGKVDLTLPELEDGHENGAETGPTSMLQKKLTDSFQVKTVKTEHTLENLSKTNAPTSEDATPKVKSVDPYREVPE